MKSFSVKQMEWLIWLLLFGVNFLTTLRLDSYAQALVYSVITISSYMLIVYINARVLIPQLYQNNKKAIYFGAAFLLLSIVSLYRAGISWWVYNTYFAAKTIPFSWAGSATLFISSLLIYITSVLFYISIRYFKLQEQQQAMERKQMEAALNLLKAQVQPHFLFNTLNNIYFFAQRESPVTASMVEQLSKIMRYFVDEAPKDLIALEAELQFISSYIELEKKRMRFPLEVTTQIIGEVKHASIPPMLIIPLVENVFKHGIDKRKEHNFMHLTVTVSTKHLEVMVENRLLKYEPHSGGVGLTNLGNRLQLLYGQHFVLKSGANQHQTIYQSYIRIPL